MYKLEFSELVEYDIFLNREHYLFKYIDNHSLKWIIDNKEYFKSSAFEHAKFYYIAILEWTKIVPVKSEII